MSAILHFLYNYIFNLILIPLFVLTMIGWPRFLIRIIYKITNLKIPYYNIPLFFGGKVVSLLGSVWCFVIKYRLDLKVLKLSEKYEVGERKNQIAEKMREARFYERNCYMFFTIFIMMVVIKKFCYNYFKYWKLEKKYANMQKEKLNTENAQNPPKDVDNKKND